MKYILGIDVGTQSVKAGLVNLETMALERVAAREYPGSALQEPADLWLGTAAAVRELAQSAGAENIAGVGLSGQMHGTMLYDSAGSVIGPVINWQDERGNELRPEFGGGSAVQQMAFLVPPEEMNDLGIDAFASGFLGVTLYHIKETQPELFTRIRRVALPTDFIRRMLTGGDNATDPTNAFSTGLFNTRENRWHAGVLEKLGLPADLLPDVKPSGEKAGEVCADAAALTGLAPGTPVVHGGGDNQMAAIGSGILEPGSPLLVNIGSGSQVCAVTGEYVKVPGIDTRSFIGENFLLVGPALTGGMALSWFRDSLIRDAEDLGLNFDGANIFRRMDELAGKVPPGCNGLAFSPLLRGTRREPGLRASFTGISTDNFTLGHRARAVMEGVVNELLDFFRRFPGDAPGSIVGAGNGLVKSALWREITARVFEMPLRVTDFENAVYGAALVAANGLGLAKLSDGRFEYVHTCEP